VPASSYENRKTRHVTRCKPFALARRRLILAAIDLLMQTPLMRFRLWPALLLVSGLAGAAYAADPEFKTGLVTESREYERETATASIGGVSLPPKKEWTSRVTVAVDGVRITGEWTPETSRSATAEDFPRGTDVQAAVKRNQLLLKHPDGSVVTAKIVRRVKPENDDERN
jgi:hypothetical protein